MVPSPFPSVSVPLKASQSHKEASGNLGVGTGTQDSPSCRLGDLVEEGQGGLQAKCSTEPGVCTRAGQGHLPIRPSRTPALNSPPTQLAVCIASLHFLLTLPSKDLGV